MNRYKNLSYLSDEQLINEILKSTIRKYAVEIGTTGDHLEHELNR
jgi:hypothetical protein